MKKKSLLRGSTLRILSPFLLLITSAALGNADVDRRYALDSVGALRSWDNVDGLFGEYVATAYKEFFSKQSRFTYQDLAKADLAFEKSKLDYNKVIEDVGILSQMARAMKVESVLRTKIYKEGPRYRFTIDWLHSPKMDLIDTETFAVEEPEGGGTLGIQDFRGALDAAILRMIKKLPFVANVTGRDQMSITVNIGASSGLKRGDTLITGTIEEVKRHPLLKTLMDWRMVQTGRAVVDELDDGIAFCKIMEEEPGRQIARYQKVVQIIAAPVDKHVVVDETDESERAKALADIPRLGFIGAGLWGGGFTREYTGSSGTVSRSGTNFMFGGKADGQLWFTRDWFGDMGFNYGMGGYSQTDSSTGKASSSVDASAEYFSFKLDVGYTYFLTTDIFGPKGWVKLGYHSATYSLPTSTSEFTGPSSFKSLFLGVGGELPIRDNYGAVLTLDFGLFPSASNGDPLTVSSSSATDVSFFVGGYLRSTQRMTLRLGIDVTSQGADFLDGTHVSDKIISVGPSLLYYF